MDFKQIKELVKLVNESNIGELLIESDEQTIRIRHLDFKKKTILTAHNSGMYMPSNAAVNAPSNENTSKKEHSIEEEEIEEIMDDVLNQNLITIKSPMIGTFYRSTTPDKPPYVKVGDIISKEDVLCIIEAMKLFNEIESEYSGKIVKVMVENESPVEYDQPLFMIDPNG